MRTSGEAHAVDDDGGDEGGTDEERRTRDQRAAAPQSPAYPIWTKIEPAKRRLPPLPAHLSRPTWARLCRQVAAFLRTRLNNTLSLRSLVRVVRAEMLLAGASPDDVTAALKSAVTDHPELSTLDRTNMLTRRLASEELVEQMLAWLHDAEAAG
ncbi:MAG TPA: hypothetical protein VKA54_01505 [Gemmatimonadaceae bacterium]|nr:hypothetical protein [Gemmatimonadaceae bacterium]